MEGRDLTRPEREYRNCNKHHKGDDEAIEEKQQQREVAKKYKVELHN